eukprot:scaffold4.g4850.t1
MSTAREAGHTPAGRRLLLAAIPAGVLAAFAGWILMPHHSPSSSTAEQAEHAALGGEQAAATEPHPKKPLDMNNPLNRWLPETDCEYCLETREKLWKMYKGALNAEHKGKGAAPPAAGGDAAAASGEGAGDMAVTNTIQADSTLNTSAPLLTCDGSEPPDMLTCFIPSAIFPERVCECVRNTCPPGNIAGYGVYSTMDECMANGATVEAVGIDPATYPAPAFPPTACPANSRAPQPDTRQGCPWAQAGLRRWDDAAAWPGGRAPSPGDVITLPPNTRVLLAACMLPRQGQIFRQIVVPAGSELILADEDMAIDLGSVLVDGALRAGSPTCRLASRLTLTFHPQQGVDPSQMGIVVRRGGTLELHGKLFTPTWTRLAATALAGASSLALQQAVNWEVGQQLVLATTTWRDEAADKSSEQSKRGVTVMFDGGRGNVRGLQGAGGLPAPHRAA